MSSVPKRVSERFAKQVGKYKGVLKRAHDRDVNESDTVTIITDMLASVFGYDKYTEVTSEQAIRGTYCDLAIKVDDDIRFLIEVKAIGLDLKEAHLRQALNYGANNGVPWIVLTNGIIWEVHRVKFDRPIDHELVCQFNFLDLTARKTEDQKKLFILCKEGLSKDAIGEFHTRVQSLNRFVIAAIIQSDPSVNTIRRELRRLLPGTKISSDEIKGLLPEVLKRDVTEGDIAKKARQKVQRAQSKAQRKAGEK